ncbi:hypothetical protein EC973_003901 [Apophysomyces ossiformis]|uniref:PH domain-containing protein n=1 Tax=Apophysomyces ossiformis TaxID=679940 RepID=A0A8H7BF83_9FUNG|nr:hypothetical protein EC973_003901 [Apophysomyces ossiformis]
MPRPNPFLRRASSPIEINNNEPSMIPMTTKRSHLLTVPEPSGTVHRPLTFRNFQQKPISIRPARFVKPQQQQHTTNDLVLTQQMHSFVKLFDHYTQKVYIEGYLMKHNDTADKPRTKCFAELCGSTLTFWDAEIQQSSIMPQYLKISDDAVVQSLTQEAEDGRNKKKHVFSITNKARCVCFEASDELTVRRWVCALRLACFEYKKLHLLFTLRLLKDIPVKAEPSFLQALLPGTTEWTRFWVTLDKKDERKLFKKTANNSSTSSSLSHLLLFDSKKSKTPAFSLTEVTHAYALYPESPQLIDKGSIMRIETPETHLLLMADSSSHMLQWLLAIYDAFKVYGRPQSLLCDAAHPTALNFGEPSEDSPRLFLEVDDVLDHMSANSTSRHETDKLFMNALYKKLLEPITASSSSPSPGSLAARSVTGRANSLPLITVACDETTAYAHAASDGDPEEEDGTDDCKFTRHVADSSDESEDDGEEDNDDDDEDKEQDSDDEPIGINRRRASHTPSGPKSMTESLIPDFDFGNGFDVPKMSRRTSNSSSFMLDQVHDDDSRSGHQCHTKEQSSSSSSSASASTSLFGDFNLAMDFNKYLENDGEKSSYRKSSLPANVKLSEYLSVDSRPGSSDMDRRRSWDHAWEEDEDHYRHQHHSNHHPHSSQHQQQRHPYDNDSYDSDTEGPMIPPLGDHFAPQNSLLDTYLGEQLSAKEQIEYARATGQPLIQVPDKPRAPQAGLIGMISQREKDRKEGYGMRVTERVNQHHADRFEREKERRILEQRQQQFLKHQIMMYTSGYGGIPAPSPPPPMAMMYPYMQAPMNGIPIMPMIPSPSPLSPSVDKSTMAFKDPKMGCRGRPLAKDH